MVLARPTFVYDGLGNWVGRDGSIILQNPTDPGPGPDPAPVFTLGVTRPTKLNTGPDFALGSLAPYTGPSSGGVLTVSAPGTYEGIDFGATNTRVRVNSNDVTFQHCNFVNKSKAIYAADPGPLIDCRGGSTYGGRYIYRCSFDNIHQWSPVTQAVMGYGFTVERCWSENFQDNFGVYVASSNSDGPLDVAILGSWLGPMSWWYSPTGGQVHSSDTKSHNDGVQWQGGRGLRIEGCDIQGTYSTTLGTGTPNSGNDTAGLGASGAPYTQAAGVAKRFEIVEGSGTYSAGKLGAFLGGSISGLMFTPVGRGSTPDALIKNNWGRGGSYWMNAGASVADAAAVTYTFEVIGNRIDNDQRIAGRAVVINSAVSKLRVPTTGPDINVWSDGSGTITRRTG